MSNYGNVAHVNLSPNWSSRDGAAIRKITVHHMAGNLSIEQCGGVFASVAREASSNYGIGTDGRVGQYVDEMHRAWTSSSYYNDREAVTIEVANSEVGGDWRISDEAWDTLVALCVDICRRNGIGQLAWTGDSSGTLTCHYMFAATACPGPYLERKQAELAATVNAILAGEQAVPAVPAAPAAEPEQPEADTGFGGTYLCQATNLNVRAAPNLGGAVVAQYQPGQTVNLDDWYAIADGYVWGRYTGASSGQLRYIAVGRATGKPEPDDFLVKQ